MLLLPMLPIVAAHTVLGGLRTRSIRYNTALPPRTSWYCRMVPKLVGLRCGTLPYRCTMPGVLCSSAAVAVRNEGSGDTEDGVSVDETGNIKNDWEPGQTCAEGQQWAGMGG